LHLICIPDLKPEACPEKLFHRKDEKTLKINYLLLKYLRLSVLAVKVKKLPTVG